MSTVDQASVDPSLGCEFVVHCATGQEEDLKSALTEVDHASVSPLDDGLVLVIVRSGGEDTRQQVRSILEGSGLRTACERPERLKQTRYFRMEGDPGEFALWSQVRKGFGFNAFIHEFRGDHCIIAVQCTGQSQQSIDETLGEMFVGWSVQEENGEGDAQ
ncbi:TPA: hypothetical protein DCL30_03805 [Candidatus Peribacteria bacterium]|nr:MAG: hypothetical protein A2529_00700 [Candidatus Peribacteria bacterium RIFOXYD2_FULL_58_15]HAI98630.1 hypothetical protein [Candidatus Peribacteria bacterium]HAS34343.1 hypothetical protein [Candidatus Peribacteria bacterium]